ncbi:MAG: KamA family radical SAM protein [Deltaproteobacteria bacterium]|nr:KamA family radical SAM protein [Deltaproteobacteria bacterium]
MAGSAWRREIAACVSDPEALPLSAAVKSRVRRVAARFPMRIPPALLERAALSDPRCPIRRQVLPDPRELAPGGALDPLDEESFLLAPGIIRRFEDRLVARVSDRCPVLCRHCNRKRFWNTDDDLATREGLARALSCAPEVREVILSGGEPLMLADRSLDAWLEAARSRAGVEVLRVHTRAPAALPARLTPGLARTLARHRPLWVVTQFNHALEITDSARRGIARLLAAGIPVLNQAVLLRGVNDSVSAQAQLGRGLVAAGIKPHYLFQLDRVTGALHFQVPVRRSLAIAAGLRARCSGLVVPHLLADLPSTGGKVPLNPDAVLGFVEGGVMLRGADGRDYLYPGP